MRKKTLFWVGLVLFTSALPAIAQGFRADCNPVGTWYGGSEFIYLLTITPTADNRYSVTYDPTYSLGLFGFPYNTKYTGELIRKGTKLRLNAMGILNMDNTLVPPDVSKLHIWAFSQTGGFIDCETLQLTDVFVGGYYWTSNKVPLKDAPDYFPVPTPIVETYHRLLSPH
jgi:hypothetical protein